MIHLTDAFPTPWTREGRRRAGADVVVSVTRAVGGLLLRIVPVDSSDRLESGGWDAHAELVRSSSDAAVVSVKCAKNGTTVGPRA
jgi:hypothetical protein